MELTGERVLLRDFTSSDVSALHAVHSDPRLLRHYDPAVGMREHAHMLVDLFVGWAAERPRNNFQLAIVDRELDTLVGSCGVRLKGCPKGQAEFGIGLHADWWGRGIALDAARLILDHGFSELGLQQIRGVAVSQNEAVSKFASRLGFSRGTPRPGEPWMTERGWDAVDWVLTRGAWEQQGAAR